MVGDLRFPCDDVYEHVATKERIKLLSTKEAHFIMPTETDDPLALINGLTVIAEKRGESEPADADS